MSASEDGIAIGNGNGSGNGAPADAPAPKNPFNFQTQVYSAGPAKPVCNRLALFHFISVGVFLTPFSPPAEHWAAPWSPLQTQFDKRNPPVLPGTSSPTAPSPARLPPDPDS